MGKFSAVVWGKWFFFFRLPSMFKNFPMDENSGANWINLYVLRNARK